jgi:hypothetical protein
MAVAVSVLMMAFSSQCLELLLRKLLPQAVNQPQPGKINPIFSTTDSTSLDLKKILLS